MLIGLDGNEANIDKRVGSNVYAYELLHQLHDITEQKEDISFRVYLKDYFQTLMPTVNDRWRYVTFGPKPLWTQWRLPLQLYLEKHITRSVPDLFFSPGHYAPRYSPVPTVITIMDLAFLQFPNDFRTSDYRQLKVWTEYSVRKAVHIFTISQSTKDDVVKYYGIKPENITVTYPGLTISTKIYEKDNSYHHMSAYLGITKPYILYIGTLQPRKNILRLIEAFHSLKKQSVFSNLKLVIVGKKGWLYDEIFQNVETLHLKEEVVFTGFVSEYEKYELIKHANVFILPSLYEGFGLPVLEAMALGVPVVASRVSSLPEVGGEAIFYIDNPYSVGDLEKNLVQVLQLTENKRLEVIAKGKKQASKFTWVSCGSKTADVLRNVVITLQQNSSPLR